MKRVVVTGLGAVTPVGIGVAKSWQSLIEGISGIGPVTRFDATGFPSRIAGEVDGFDPAEYVSKKDVKKMDTFIHYAIAAAKMAVDDSGLEITEENAERVEPDQRTIKKMGYRVIGSNIIDAKDYVRHDSHKLSRIIMSLIGEYTRKGTI